MSLLIDLYNFLRKPKELDRNNRKFFSVLKEFVIYDLAITFLWALVIGILTVLFEEFAIIFQSKKKLDNTIVDAFLTIVFIAPLMEELAYRYSLKATKLTVSVSLSIQVVIYFHLLKIFEIIFIERILLMILISFVFYYTISKNACYFINKNFNVYFYYNLLAFSLLHAINFSYLEISHYLFIPILISLQFFFGLYLSFIRLKQSFLYAAGFHIIHNALIFGLGYIVT